MAEIYRLTINLSLVASRLAEGQAQALTPGEVENALVEAGFTRRGDDWIAEEVSLGWLNSDEIMDIQLIG